MRLPYSTLFLAGAAAVIASCSMAPAPQGPTPRATRELAEALAGRTQRPPVACIPSYRDTQMQVIDDWTILFRDGATVYVQHPRGGCRGLGIGGYTLVSHKFGTTQSCEGDINQLVDLRTGAGGGSCVFGPFIPYTRN